MVVVDYFSRYIEIAHFTNLSEDMIIASLKNISARWGCPNELLTDNGSQFSGKAFVQFLKTFDFKHITTSPHDAQANSETEGLHKQLNRDTANVRQTNLLYTSLPKANLKLAWPDLQQAQKINDRTKQRYR